MEIYYKCQVCWNEFGHTERPEKPGSEEGLQLEACPYCGSQGKIQELLTGRTSILRAMEHFFGTSPTFLEEENEHRFEKVLSEQVQIILRLFTPIGPDSEEVHLDELLLQIKNQGAYKPISRLTKVGKIMYMDPIQDPLTQTSYLALKIEKQSWETVTVLKLELHPDGSFVVHFE